VDLADGVGGLDQTAIDGVRAQAWPDVRNADELHDALLSLVLLPAEALGSWREWMAELIATGTTSTPLAPFHIDRFARQ
jgi:ATP-dependent Lhr-like helicase